MSESATQSLRVINGNLRAALARLRGEQEPSAAVVPPEFAGLLVEIRHATDCLRSRDLNAATDLELEKEVSAYRTTIEQLAKVLPSVSGRLLTEKARLEAARSHVMKAAAWAQARAKTL
jgi:hypothetical protein